ncbi:MAG: FtsX-like permease family protein [Romboutsia timonensis]|nr:FtsX-like permease family protein [Romboutsia timonensis]
MLIISIIFSISFLLNQFIKELKNDNNLSNQISIEVFDNNLLSSVDTLTDGLSSYKFVDYINTTKTNGSELIYIYTVLDKNYNKDRIVSTLESYLDENIGSKNYIFINDQSLDSKLKIIKSITNIIHLVFYLVLFFTFISVNIMLKKILDERSQEIALYKSVGYKNIDLFKLIFYELLIMVIYSYIISSIFSILMLYFFYVQYLYIINIQLNLVNIILIYISLLILWILLVLIISFISMIKMKNIPAILLFNE